MDLRDFKKNFFGSDRLYNSLSNSDKNKNSFIINRIMASKYPSLANYLNHTESFGNSLIDSWRSFNVKYGIFDMKYVSAKKSEDKKKVWKPEDKEIFKLYLEHRNIASRDFETWFEFEPIKAKKDFKDFESNFK
jgi:hypothetical protein